MAQQAQATDVGLAEAAPLPDNLTLAMRERVLAAVRRLEAKEGVTYTYMLYENQASIFQDVEAYMREAAEWVHQDQPRPFARIVLPPRTGKTVIAGKLIATTGLTAVYFVPTKALADQVARELAKQLPHTLIGVYTSDRKEIVPQGINVVTYDSMNNLWKAERVPREISSAALVFADEAHHAMTKLRMAYLRNAFDPTAIRIALTATPDYNEKRMLAHFFPSLIHEVMLPEAVQLGLVAPLRVWVAEVDEDASKVEIAKGDYQEGVLGRLMTSAPFFEAVKAYRYAPENIGLSTLITCVSKQQAYDLVKYLEKHRPVGAPKSALIIGETPSSERRRIFEQFELGKIDTIVSVHVLIEGWDAPICKLLIDLSPSISLVRSTQKFCRVLTLFGDQEARIYVILPKNLARPPIMPMEILCPNLDAYECGELVGPKEQKGEKRRPALRHPRHHPIAKVELKSRILLTAQVENPRLNPASIGDVRAVLRSNRDFDIEDPPTFWEFRALRFEHPLFTGLADHLLRFTGYYGSGGGRYRAFLEKYCPEILLGKDAKLDTRTSRDEALEFLATLLTDRGRKGESSENYQLLLRVLRGYGDDDRITPFDLLGEREDVEMMRRELPHLMPIEQKILRWRFGLDDEDELTLKEIGDKYNLSRERIRHLQEQALGKLRKSLRSVEMTDKEEELVAPVPKRKEYLDPTIPPHLVGELRLAYLIERYGKDKYQKLMPTLWIPSPAWWHFRGETPPTIPPPEEQPRPPPNIQAPSTPALPSIDPTYQGWESAYKAVEAYGVQKYEQLVSDVSWLRSRRHCPDCDQHYFGEPEHQNCPVKKLSTESYPRLA